MTLSLDFSGAYGDQRLHQVCVDLGDKGSALVDHGVGVYVTTCTATPQLLQPLRTATVDLAWSDDSLQPGDRVAWVHSATGGVHGRLHLRHAPAAAGLPRRGLPPVRACCGPEPGAGGARLQRGAGQLRRRGGALRGAGHRQRSWTAWCSAGGPAEGTAVAMVGAAVGPPVGAAEVGVAVGAALGLWMGDTVSVAMRTCA